MSERQGEREAGICSTMRRRYRYCLWTLLLLGAVVAGLLASLRTQQSYTLEDLVDGYNVAMNDWRIEDADRYARLAARHYPDSGTSKLMTEQIQWIRNHPAGGWREMVDSTGRNPKYHWIGPPGTTPTPPTR